MTRSTRRRLMDRLFASLCLAAAALSVAMLLLLLGKILTDGIGRLSFDFVSKGLSSRPARTGILPAILGSLWTMALTAIVAVPLGVAAAVYLEEFQTRKSRLTRIVQLSIANLAGVPSIVYGLLGLAVFVRGAGMGSSVLAGALTLGLLILPTVILVTQEALRAVPRAYREASLGLGVTTWGTIRHQVLPNAAPGILTGLILALSRAIGETAPLVVVGAVVGVVSSPSSPGDRYTALPVQIFNWARDSKPGFHDAAAAAIVVLMAALLLMNSVAIVLRNRAQKRLS